VSDSVTPLTAASVEIGAIKGAVTLIVGRDGLANGMRVGICISGVDDVVSIAGSMEAGALDGVVSEEGHVSFQML
jgi:hypothetical protein